MWARSTATSTLSKTSGLQRGASGRRTPTPRRSTTRPQYCCPTSPRRNSPWNATGWPPRRVAAATARSYRQRKRIVAVATRVGATLHVDYENFAADPRGALSQILGLVAAPEAVSTALAGIAPPRPETEVDASAAFAEPGRVKEALEAACLGWTWHGGSFTGSRDPQPLCGL